MVIMAPRTYTLLSPDSETQNDSPLNAESSFFLVETVPQSMKRPHFPSASSFGLDGLMVTTHGNIMLISARLRIRSRSSSLSDLIV